MKNPVLAIFVFLFALSLELRSQIVVPDLSPYATITQKVGFNEVRIEYSRPSVRGRVIFGSLVPFGQVWRTGANSSTKVYTREDLRINDQYTLSAGLYGLYSIPGKEEWTIIFSKDPFLWGAFKYQQGYDAIRFTVKPEKLDRQVETFTINFSNVSATSAELELMWDFTKVKFRMSTNADDKVMAQIKTFTSNPEAKVSGDYFLAAKYYLDTDRDLNLALEWIDKALNFAPESYWMLHTKAEIQAKMGDYNKAIETANLSAKYAKEKDDDDYVRMNAVEIAQWKEVKKNK